MTKNIKIQIEVDGPILYGAISTAVAKCGTQSCRCHYDSDALHGPYYRWTGTINGKRTTKTISKEIAYECELRIANYRKLQQQLDRLLKEAINSAPWSGE
ncbi:DUF6788 family protein [Bdellovibrionota bacterium FG-2]